MPSKQLSFCSAVRRQGQDCSQPNQDGMSGQSSESALSHERPTPGFLNRTVGSHIHTNENAIAEPTPPEFREHQQASCPKKGMTMISLSGHACGIFHKLSAVTKVISEMFCFPFASLASPPPKKNKKNWLRVFLHTRESIRVLSFLFYTIGLSVFMQNIRAQKSAKFNRAFFAHCLCV